MAAETMKEYLVKIGWNVDEASFKNAKSSIAETAQTLIGSASGIASSFLKAGGIVADAIIGINEQMISLVQTTAQLDYETERMARQYWSTEKNVRAFSTALSALGETESSMMYMTNEQYARFIELNKLGRTLEAPSGLDEYLKKVRDVNFEFSRLKMIAQYGTRWVVYWISKFTGKDVETLTAKLRSFGDYLIKNLPQITEKVSRFFWGAYRLGKAAVMVVKGLGNALVSLVDTFDSSFTRILAIVTVLGAAMLKSPVFAFVAALTALLLVIEDYMSWKEGKLTVFDWAQFDESLTDLKQSLSDLNDQFTPIKEAIDGIFDKLDLKQKAMDALKAWLDSVSGFLDIIKIALDGIHNLIGLLSGDFSALMSDGAFGKFIDAVNKISNSPIFKLSDYIQNPLQIVTDIAADKIAGLFSTDEATESSAQALVPLSPVTKTLTQNNDIHITVSDSQVAEVQNRVEQALINNRAWMERAF